MKLKPENRGLLARWLNPIGRGGLLARWPEAERWPVDVAHGHAAVARLVRASRRGRLACGVVTVAGVDAVARAARAHWQHEYEDREGKSSGKKDGGAAHQGGSGTDEVADGATRWRFIEGGGAVEAEGLTGVQPEESSLASTWRSGRRRAPVRCSSK
jgi:hypothetical protein